MLYTLKDLFRHSSIYDKKLLEKIQVANGQVAEVMKEFLHIIGAKEVWLARLQHRVSEAAVWPVVNENEVVGFYNRIEEKFNTYLSGLGQSDMTTIVEYKNRAGQKFADKVGDILLHIILYSQYHRGKINLLLRQYGYEPVPADYIAYVRGAPAVTG